MYDVCTHYNPLIEGILMDTLNIPLFVFIEDRKGIPKLSPFASWPGAMINHQCSNYRCLEKNIHGPKDVWAIEVRLHIRMRRHTCILTIHQKLWILNKLTGMDVDHDAQDA